jgi:hypothetical protein
MNFLSCYCILPVKLPYRNSWRSTFKSTVNFLLLVSFQKFHASPRPRVRFHIKLSFFFLLPWRVLTPRSTSKLEDHSLSAILDCLFSLFGATLHIWRPLPPSATPGRAMPLWEGPT